MQVNHFSSFLSLRGRRKNIFILFFRFAMGGRKLWTDYWTGNVSVRFFKILCPNYLKLAFLFLFLFLFYSTILQYIVICTEFYHDRGLFLNWKKNFLELLRRVMTAFELSPSFPSHLMAKIIMTSLGASIIYYFKI